MKWQLAASSIVIRVAMVSKIIMNNPRCRFYSDIEVDQWVLRGFVDNIKNWPGASSKRRMQDLSLLDPNVCIHRAGTFLSATVPFMINSEIVRLESEHLQ